MVAGDWGLPLLGAGTLHGSLWVRHFLQHLCRYVGYYCRATAGSEDAEMNLLGDSYAMGYFLYNHESIAAQLAERSGIPPNRTLSISNACWNGAIRLGWS